MQVPRVGAARAGRIICNVERNQIQTIDSPYATPANGAFVFHREEFPLFLSQGTNGKPWIPSTALSSNVHERTSSAFTTCYPRASYCSCLARLTRKNLSR